MEEEERGEPKWEWVRDEVENSESKTKKKREERLAWKRYRKTGGGERVIDDDDEREGRAHLFREDEEGVLVGRNLGGEGEERLGVEERELEEWMEGGKTKRRRRRKGGRKKGWVPREGR